ncbi:protein FAR1-RELATED SEQUENCE 5-like [Salvia miltiorrhiza]|uniref:protein FAR1-RELATED SEQUENCE 5-like n=1 Tax=Salvia miltiorrhiza TaxID=226208 RepID=UPI0025AC3E94|nr:protein FAR1-RELATED SEQUENCE 5-like [Salvia miltiorrhiza]
MRDFIGDESGGEGSDTCYREGCDDRIEAVIEDETDATTEMGSNNTRSNTNDALDGLEALQRSYENRLLEGTAIGSLHEVHKLYCDYAILMGFSVRKGTQGYFKPTINLRMKMYLCSCAGPPDNKSSEGRLAAYKKQTYRSNCNAMLRVAHVNVEAPWIITTFVKQHNHKLVNPSQSYLLRSAHNMSRQQKRLLISMRASGIGVSRAYLFLENEAESRQNIGFIRKYVYNELHSDSRNASKVDNADANKLLEILIDRGLSDHSFYWKVKLKDDGRLKNLFFRDTWCLIDCQHFDDVLSVDATYKTNKYNLICVPMVDINHHRMNVLFGLSFLSNEKAVSYEWLFSTFLQAMYHKEPSIVFSDQDMAVVNAMDSTFRQASHRLCQ